MVSIVIDFKIDSGSDVNILPFNDYLRIIPKSLLRNTDINIEAYGSFKIKCVGSTTIDSVIISQNKTCLLKFLVVKFEVEESCCPILGLPASEKLK